ncbi:MAG: FMN-binding negative transcriptional regulator [Geminicoccaceae bacterium]|nr:FMN-binding negative transcriptional regulator [Geminicoccaceae bacterium]
MLYTKPVWDPPALDDVHRLIDRLAFAAFVSQGADGPAVSHLVFVRQDGGPHGTLVSHLARDNDHCALVEAGAPSVAVFTGPHAYVSSSWYPAEPVRDSAPTWNFAVVHCHGRPVPTDDGETARHLHELTSRLERGRESAWSMGELGPGGVERRLPRIRGFRLPIARLEAKFKMGQDERWPDTKAAIGRLEAEGPGEVAAMMRDLNKGR